MGVGIRRKRYVIQEIDRTTGIARLYGKKNTDLVIDCRIENVNKEVALKEMVEFMLKNGYQNYGNVCHNPAWSIGGSAGKRITSIRQSDPEHSAKYCLNEIIQEANYDKRLEALKDAQAFFRSIEGEENFSLEFPVNCTSLEVVQTPRTIIRVADGRTYISDDSFVAYDMVPKCGYVSFNTRDFSRLSLNEVTYQNREIERGLPAFADAWPEIKKACEAMLKKPAAMNHRQVIHGEYVFTRKPERKPTVLTVG